MRKLLALLILLAAPSWAATYYVDNCDVTGNDGNNGTSTSTPWLTINKVNTSSFSAGDSILFKKDCTWREQLTVPSSGSSGSPITFGAYGSGADPIITGANLITPGSSWSATSSWATGASYPSDSNSTSVFTRAIVPANKSSVTGTKIRITIKARTDQDTAIRGTSIGVMTTNEIYDATPTRITWDGGSSTTTITANTSKVSDEITFAFTKTSRHGVSIYSGADQYIRVIPTSVGDGSYWNWTDGDVTMVQDIDVDGSHATISYGLELLEVYSAQANAWQAACTTEPGIVFFDGTKGIKETSVANLNTATEWFWVSNILCVFSTSDPDTAYTSPGIEAGARDNALLISGKNYAIVDSLEFIGTNDKLIRVEGSVTGVQVKNCEVSYNGGNQGIILWITGGTGQNIVDGCVIHDTASDGVVWLAHCYLPVQGFLPGVL